jgi:hypothetical protein
MGTQLDVIARGELAAATARQLVDVERCHAEITEEVANVMDYDLPQGIFCKRFADKAKAAFKSKYPGLGASVTNP